MIIALLIATFVIALAVASIVVLAFTNPIGSSLTRVDPTDVSHAWARYLKYAIYVVGIGGGVRVWDFEKYLAPVQPYAQVVSLTPNRWMLEVYQTTIGTLQSTAMVLLAFFIFGLLAVVIVRVFDARSAPAELRGAQGEDGVARRRARSEASHD